MTLSSVVMVTASVIAGYNVYKYEVHGGDAQDDNIPEAEVINMADVNIT